ncbi:4-azaleucine resistance transporter AzlC [Natronospira proteinivora]|uniref:4-azaleucine resistance transporter AzlC n=1 Tax=Natronospira proteinivora TaxID=1807133 RepID=A0ABT1GAI8_9GAMM|nr:AzlC family ABC transporter permease [Natronospira proteinivora]MCP1728067.1 4-azaleucine resistance transporter AzlC [Natronospira proteinivora]
MQSSQPTPPYHLRGDRIGREFLQLLPMGLFVAIFGIAYGLAAVQTGLAPWQATLMSTTVFAGAAQFAVLGMWGSEVALLAIIAITLAINSRHILMGAALFPMLQKLPAGRRYGLLLLLTDANWARSYQQYQSGRENLEAIIGGGLALWLAWIAGTAFGTYFGRLLADPEAMGLDMVLGCFLLAMALSGPRSRRILLVWLVAGVSAVLAWYWLPPHVHVVVGALAGGLVGLFWREKPHVHD